MKTLIITMTCGEGHNQIAKALKKGFDGKGEDTKIIQLYGFSKKLELLQNRMFLCATKYIPHIYEQVWTTLCNRNPKRQESAYMNSIIRDCKEYILSEIEAYQPDAIVCTHINAGAVIDKLKREGKLSKSIKTYGMVFDYCLCPYWETNTNLDYVVLPHEYMEPDLEKKGFKREQMLTLGLPVDEKFTKNINKTEARRRLGLDENKFTVVLYSGGNCVSSAYDIIKQLLKADLPIQIVSVCGRNKKQYQKVEELIKKQNLTNVLNLGFCDCLETVFAAGDVAFSRGGGCGVTEELNSHLPFVFREKLVLNEKITKQLFDEKGLGIAMKQISSAPKILTDLYNNPEKLTIMSEKSKDFCKPRATLDLVEKIIENFNIDQSRHSSVA
jgi:processive 1,2-diacylglycerol beta-glucosyltransferase